MKNTKLEITHDTKKIYLRFSNPEFQKVGFTDYSDELWRIINTVKWHIKTGKYIYSGNKSLHRVVMEYWHGKEYCEKNDEDGFVIDHIDNDGFNCLYENLAFLNARKNWHYKGNYYDKERVEKIPIATVNIFKKNTGDKFQITMGFNKVPLIDSKGQQISKAFFVYDTKDYDLVLADAVALVESLVKGEIDINNLRCDLSVVEPFYYAKVKGTRPKTGSIMSVNGKTIVVHGNDYPVFHKIAPDNTLW